MNDDELFRLSRRLRDVTEPIAASVYFSPEAHAGYKALGLDFIPGYFCSRSACLGTAPWPVVCAAFGAFKPAVVRDAITAGWALTEPEPILAARLAGAEAQLERLLGPAGAEVERATELLVPLTVGVDPSGRMLFSGLSALPWPESPWGRFWRATDLVREHRGDGHIAAWIPHVDSCEVTVLSELAWEIPPRTYVLTRGYDADDVDAAYERLEARGLVRGHALTAAGRELRGTIERNTDRAGRVVVERLANRADELFDLLEPWATAILAAREYPVNPADMPEIR